MKMDVRILTANICSCKIIEIPPVGRHEMEQIIRYKLSSFYPGSVEDLVFDYIKNDNSVAVFYMQKVKLETIKEENPGVAFYSPYHLLKDLKNKEGMYILPLKGRLEVLEFKENSLIEIRSLLDTPEIRSDFENVPVKYPEFTNFSCKKAQALFSEKKKGNNFVQIVLLITMIMAVPQAFYYQQIVKDEKYLEQLNNSIAEMSLKSAQISASEEQLNLLIAEYTNLIDRKPLNIYDFFSDLSFALGSDVEIESLILKEKSFQMNGRGLNPLGKMESFQKNDKFDSVLPYQVQKIEDSSLEKFSLTGFYDYE